MRWLGRTDLRVLFAILITALIPLVGSTLAARAILARISATAFQPEFGAHLDGALTVYADLARSMKESLRHEAASMASSTAARDPAFFRDPQKRNATLAALAGAHPHAAALRVEPCAADDAAPAAEWKRPAPIDPATERAFHVRALLRPGADPALLDADSPEPACEPDGTPLRFTATFSVPRARFDELEDATQFAQAYHEVERNHREEYLDATYRNAFFALLALTMVIGVAVALLVATPVTSGIAALARATEPVAAGDLSVRVTVRGKGEVAALGRAFNRMLEELEQSRARVEFLRRVGEWQKVARRLAHEIKNPLTPIQLAVEECHRRYRGDDAGYRHVLDTTLEVVSEEVSSLRRLVTEFSGFARLPRASLAPGDLAKLLADERAHFAALGDGSEHARDEEAALFARVDVRFDVPAASMPAAFDREMIHRVLGNIVKNAAQALRDARPSRGGEEVRSWGSVHVTARTEDGAHVIDVDDDGPGIPAEVRTTLFDPYVTTKRDGTGLGLTIVKKIVVDHGGTIEVKDSPSGGARFRVRLPCEGTAASAAAVERSVAEGERAPG
jgi:nitrogen fixation/metabolism regulation signal transduction histidine kinase